MNEKEKQIANKIRDAIDEIWSDYYTQEGIECGDIAPLEVVRYDSHIEEIAKLIYKIGESNKGDE